MPGQASRAADRESNACDIFGSRVSGLRGLIGFCKAYGVQSSLGFGDFESGVPGLYGDVPIQGCGASWRVFVPSGRDPPWRPPFLQTAYAFCKWVGLYLVNLNLREL